MNELTILYFFAIVWLTPWIVALIYVMYKFKRLNNKLNKFIEENIEDEEEHN